MPIKVTNLFAAKQYQGLGYSIIPVFPNKFAVAPLSRLDMEPVTGFNLNNWFEYNMLIGIVTGKVSGLTVIDVEVGGDYRKLPLTLTAQTGGGGRHYYYKYCDKIESQNLIMPKIDILNDGYYAIAPPSVSEFGEYKWLNNAKIVDFPIGLFKGKTL